MSAADRRTTIDRGSPVRVTLRSGETVEMPYRKAVGLISLGRATWAEETPKKRAAKKATK